MNNDNHNKSNLTIKKMETCNSHYIIPIVILNAYSCIEFIPNSKEMFVKVIKQLLKIQQKLGSPLPIYTTETIHLSK